MSQLVLRHGELALDPSLGLAVGWKATVMAMVFCNWCFFNGILMTIHCTSRISIEVLWDDYAVYMSTFFNQKSHGNVL